MTALADVRKAAQALKAKVSSHKTKTVVSVAEQLCSNLTLLELSAPSSKSLEKLCLLFRRPLIPLYKHFTAQACLFASTLFEFIHEEKVVKADDEDVLQSWEKVLHAIVSGVVDYLEDESSGKSTVASSFYPILCRIYFSATTPKYQTDVWFACDIYILLLETATGHQENQQALRNVHLRGGWVLSRITYLKIEALLELLANIMPTKGFNEFLNNVFDPELFSRHKELKALMTVAPKSDWDEISCQIYRVFASMDISNPQPFTIVKSSITGQTPSPSGLLWVDEKGFTSNIVEDGRYRTFEVPYPTIVKMNYSSYEQSPTCTTFTFRLKSPPTVGKAVTAENVEATWTLDMDRRQLQAFLKVLKARNVKNVINPSERKLSKLGVELSLEFPSSSLSLTEKVQQFCDFPSEIAPTTSTSPRRVATEASPPVPIEATETSDEIVVPIAAEAPLPSSPNKSHGDSTVKSRQLEQTSELLLSDDVQEGKSAESHPTPDKKRKRLESSEDNKPATKRPRNELAAEGRSDPTSLMFAKKSPKMTKRYGKKLRTSSPSPAGGADSDFEEIPAPRTNAKAMKARLVVEQKPAKGGKAAAMKGKVGKKVVVASPKRPAKKEQDKPGKKNQKGTTKEKVALAPNLLGRSLTCSQTEGDITTIEETEDTSKPRPRRSTRVKEQDKPKVVYKEVSSQSDKEVVEVVPEPERKPATQKDSAVDAESRTVDDGEENTSSATGGLLDDVEVEYYEDVVVPVKMEIDASDEVLEQVQDLKGLDNDKTMIDLTLDDDSPPAKSKSRKAPSRPQPVKRSVLHVEKRNAGGKSRKQVEVIDVDDEDEVNDVAGTQEPPQRFPWSPDPAAQKMKPVLASKARHSPFQNQILDDSAKGKTTDLAELATSEAAAPLEHKRSAEFFRTENAPKPVSKPANKLQLPVVFTPKVPEHKVSAERPSPITAAVPAAPISAPTFTPEPEMVMEEPYEPQYSPQAPDGFLTEPTPFIRRCFTAVPTFTPSPAAIKEESSEPFPAPSISTKRPNAITGPVRNMFALEKPPAVAEPKENRLSGTRRTGSTSQDLPKLATPVKRPSIDNLTFPPKRANQTRPFDRFDVPKPEAVGASPPEGANQDRPLNRLAIPNRKPEAAETFPKKKP
ncbi:hypothetical protein V5O48_011367, partial [Marasmius crinis-equi]